MSEPVSAAIHIQGPSLRCSELVWKDSGPSLRRYGHRTFEVDLGRVLRGEAASPEALDRVEAAVEEELGGTEAPEIGVVLPPIEAFSFFTPISAGLSERDRTQHVVQQAALVAGVRSPNSLSITSQVVRTVDGDDEEPIEWVHVLAEPEAVDERTEALVAALPARRRSHRVSSEAAARLAGHVEVEGGADTKSETSGPYSLAVGQYSTHTEYTLTHDQAWHHAHASQDPRSPANQAYFAVSFLNRIHVPLGEIGRLYLYGDEVDRGEHGPLERVLGRSPELLDPFQVLSEFPERPEGDPAVSYVPCIGAALSSAPR
ncbi:MAG: hypothetical protein ABEL04_01385 [Salinibacter sp.]|uniref:hypothetical protein n=1 Tax=Salinibacter sp. TaxID=2065818 RepID=UPI0035D49EE7